MMCLRIRIGGLYCHPVKKKLVWLGVISFRFSLQWCRSSGIVWWWPLNYTSIWREGKESERPQDENIWFWSHSCRLSSKVMGIDVGKNGGILCPSIYSSLLGRKCRRHSVTSPHHFDRDLLYCILNEIKGEERKRINLLIPSSLDTSLASLLRASMLDASRQKLSHISPGHEIRTDFLAERWFSSRATY